MNTFTTLEDFVNEYIDKDEYRMSRIRVKSNAYCKFDGPYSEILMVYRLNDNSLVDYYRVFDSEKSPKIMLSKCWFDNSIIDSYKLDRLDTFMDKYCRRVM